MIVINLKSGGTTIREESELWLEFLKTKDYDFMQASVLEEKKIEFATAWIHSTYDIQEEYKFRTESHFQQRL